MENKDLIYFFSSIKNDNIQNYQKIIQKNPFFINYKNNKKENILFYAFEKNSIKIIDFILSDKKNISLILEKNSYNLNILQYLIQKKIDINYFLEKIKNFSIEEQINLLKAKDVQKNNIFFMAIKNQNNSNINKLIEKLKEFDLFNKMKNERNQNQQNILHILCLYYQENFLPIIENIEKNLKLEKDNNDFSPIMIASYKQNFENFIQIYEQQENSHELLLLGANNKDEKVMNFLLEKNDINHFNFLEPYKHPLAIAISKKNIKIIPQILKKLNTKILPQYFCVSLIKNYNFMPFLVNKIFENYQFEKDKYLEKELILSSFLNLNFENLVKIINKNNYDIENSDLDSCFKNTIIGKKDMVLKIHLLIKNGLSFNEKNLQYLLMLPKNQIEFILNKTSIMKLLSKEHKSLLNFIVDYKNLNIDIPKYFLTKSIKKEIFQILEKNLNFFNNQEQWNHIKQYLNTSEISTLFLKFAYGEKSTNILLTLKKYFPLFQIKEKKEIFYKLVENIWLSEKSELSQYFFKYKKILIKTFFNNLSENKIPKNDKFILFLKKQELKFIEENHIIQILNNITNDQLFFLKKINPLFIDKKFNFEKISVSLLENQLGYEIWNFFSNKVDNQQEFVKKFLNYAILKKEISLYEIKNFVKKLEDKNNLKEVYFNYCLQENIENDKINYFYYLLDMNAQLKLQKFWLENNYFNHLNLIKKDYLHSKKTELNIQYIINYEKIEDFILWIKNKKNIMINEELENYYKQIIIHFKEQSNDIMLKNFLHVINEKINNFHEESIFELLQIIEEKEKNLLTKLTGKYDKEIIFSQLIKYLKSEKLYLLEKYTTLFSKENKIIFEKLKLSNQLEKKLENKKLIKI